MTIKSHMNKNYWNQTSNIFFSPKLSLQGKSALPQIVQCSYTFHRQQPFLTVLKKPINNVYDNFILRKQRQRELKQRQRIKERKHQPVYVLGKVKEVFEKEKQKRESNTANSKDRKSQTLQEYQILINPGRNFSQKFALSVPKCISQKKTVFIPNNQTKDSKYLFYIGVGNNSALVQKILSNRVNWDSTNSTLFNLRWQQARPKFHNMSITQKQLINHLPNHEAISDKGSLLKNLKSYCQKNDQQLFQILPVCFEFDFQNPDLCQNQLKRFVQYFWQDQERIKKSNNYVSQKNFFEQQAANTSLEDKDFMSNSSSFSPKKSSSISPKKKGNQSSINNHDFIIYDTPKITKKDSSTANSTSTNSSSKNSSNGNKNVRNVNKRDINANGSNSLIQNSRKKQEIKALYKTFISKLKPYYSFQDMSNLKKQPASITPTTSQVYGQTSLWLLKPTDLNRGRGIKLFHDSQQLGDLLHNQLLKNQKGSFIVQKYIERPMLIAQRKFDIRIWTLVTQNRQLFVFKQGYIRTSSEKYTLDSSSQFTHLTNNAVQKYSKKYGEFIDGNILPLKKLLRRNTKKGQRDHNDTGFPYLMDEEEFNIKMKQKIQVSFASVWDKIFNQPEKLSNSNTLNGFGPGSTNSLNNNSINFQNKTKYFQIFGYDFMVDIKKNLWLIQVNTNPCIQLSNSFLKEVIPRMLDDAFKLTVDKVYPSKKQDNKNHFSSSSLKQQKRYPVENYQDDENLWQKLDFNQKYEMTIIQTEQC